MGAARTRLRVRVSPGASRTAVSGRHGEAWKVRVAAPPEAGRANEAVVALLAQTLSLPRRSVTLVAGLERAEAERRLAEAGGAA